jgi:hypothetical protein
MPSSSTATVKSSANLFTFLPPTPPQHVYNITNFPEPCTADAKARTRLWLSYVAVLHSLSLLRERRLENVFFSVRPIVLSLARSTNSPWLAQSKNLEILAEALHLDQLTLEATERDVGRFSADIVVLSTSAVSAGMPA